MARGTTARRAVERASRICREHDDARTLRVAFLDEIQRTVGFDAYAWLLTDPETEVGGSPLADVPWLPDLPRQIRLKYQTSVHRWTQLGRPPVALLRAGTRDRPDESLVWREFLVHHGVHDVASVVFRDRFGCWAFLELWRMDKVSYTAADAAYLEAITEPLTAALRRCQAETFSYAAPLAAEAGPVVLVLSPELDVRAQTPETEEYLRRLVPPDADRRPVPAGAYNVGAQLLAVEADVDDHAPTARVHFGEGIWLTMRAARIGNYGDQGTRDVAVTIERTPPAQRVEVFARAHALTPREAEVLRHLLNGADTRDVATRMFVSEHTVQDYLKSVFRKTKDDSRRTLLARAAGR